MQILHSTLVLLSLGLSVPALWFAIQVFQGCRRIGPRRGVTDIKTSLNLAILIPAHNESIHLLPTLRSVFNQAQDNTRVLVVADNCTDDTATVASAAGAEVIERTDMQRRGKGYALDFGIKHLSAAPPDVVIVMDADCTPETNAISALATLVQKTNKPAQALYLMKTPGDQGLRGKVAQFAWRVKNQVRPRGLHSMGLPCQLTGSGMAFPWHALQQVSLANGHLVEDMQLGMSLIELGYGPIFAEQAVVSSQFPANVEGARTQRTRWEHGHLSMIVTQGLPKLWQGLRRRNPTLFLMALDICIPPLSLLILILTCLTVLTGVVGAASGHWLPVLLCAAALTTLGTAVMSAWMKFGRDTVSAVELLLTPVYAVLKLPVYIGFVIRRQSAWVRSKRDGEDT